MVVEVVESDHGDLLGRGVEPEHDGDDDHGEDEEDDDADCNVDKEGGDHAVGGVHLGEGGIHGTFKS